MIPNLILENGHFHGLNYRITEKEDFPGPWVMLGNVHLISDTDAVDLPLEDFIRLDKT